MSDVLTAVQMAKKRLQINTVSPILGEQYG